MATHSSILGWRLLPEEPGRLQVMGSQRVRPDWATKTFTFTFTFTLPQTLPYLRQKSLRDCMLPLLVLASFLLPYRLLFSMCSTSWKSDPACPSFFFVRLFVCLFLMDFFSFPYVSTLLIRKLCRHSGKETTPLLLSSVILLSFQEYTSFPPPLYSSLIAVI